MSDDNDYENDINSDKEIRRNNFGPRRDLTDEELGLLHEYYAKMIPKDHTDKQIRNYTLLFTCLYTGLRINEVLSLNIGDVVHYGRIADVLSIYESKVDRKRDIYLNDKIKKLLENYVDKKEDLKHPLFKSRGIGRLCSRQASNIFHKAFSGCELSGLLGCHSTRKTFSRKTFEKSTNNVFVVQKALGHKSILTTYKYLNSTDGEVKNVVKSLEF